MSTAAIANDLVTLCRQGKNLEAIAKYYADDIVSVESAPLPGLPAELKGIEAVKGKNQWFFENNEIHDETVNGPYIGENQFAVEFISAFTQKASGKRVQMREIALYTVKDGKIVHEHFYYNPGA